MSFLQQSYIQFAFLSAMMIITAVLITLSYNETIDENVKTTLLGYLFATFTLGLLGLILLGYYFTQRNQEKSTISNILVAVYTLVLFIMSQLIVDLRLLKCQDDKFLRMAGYSSVIGAFGGIVVFNTI